MAFVQTLSKDQRNLLAKTVLEARDAAEAGAKKTLHMLGVDEADAPSDLTTEQRELRRALRAQARQLGDGESVQRKGIYSIWNLTEKIAYDQWHRMLFARFLAENNLLISPKYQVPTTLDECNELAPELGLRDGWQVAARFAAEMLPQIFRAEDPAGRINLAPEDRKTLQQHVNSLPREILISDDALGLAYQFWQGKRKDEINASGTKIGPHEIAPVTQLFTDDYMVLSLLHNTLGSWWAGKNLRMLNGLSSEEECRKTLAMDGIDWSYLRLVNDEVTGEWRPSSGSFDGWPRTAKELRIIDPCMGSGHFLVRAIPIVVAFRMREEGLSRGEACDAVLRDNLFGLELDSRCTQIGAFNLALTAWKIAGYRKLPMINIACCGLKISAGKEEWLELGGKDERLRAGLDRLYDLFSQAPILGSLINPATVEFSKQKPLHRDLSTAGLAELRPLLESALTRGTVDDFAREMAVTAHGLSTAAETLAGKYTLVITNPPFLGRGLQGSQLADFLLNYYPEGKDDLATGFALRLLDVVQSNGTLALVLPQYTTYLKIHGEFRKRLRSRSVRSIARLGTHAFTSIGGTVVQVILVIIESRKATDNQSIAWIEAASGESPDAKSINLRSLPIMWADHCTESLSNPFEPRSRTKLRELSSYARAWQGFVTGDVNRYTVKFWEIMTIGDPWRTMVVAPDRTDLYRGRTTLLRWEGGKGSLASNHSAHNFNPTKVLGMRGILIAQVGYLAATLYDGEYFSDASCPLIPFSQNDLPAVWAYCSSSDYARDVREVNQSIVVRPGYLTKVQFDLEYWRTVAEKAGPLQSPGSNDPTQWLFNGHPRCSDQPLQVAVARLLGYEWPCQAGHNLANCPELGPDGLEKYADKDGIVCISSIKGEQPAAERLTASLAASFGSEWSASKLSELLKEVGYEGRGLEDWLRNGFFDQHCQLFHQRPFIWHIWDGRKDGFSAIVNYHKLDRSSLEKLTYTYLNDWIARQRTATEMGDEGSDARLKAAIDLKARLEMIMKGEQPYDIFVRWKSIEEQPIGWEPDFNDGVRLNIRPFVTAGVLRKNPKISWGKDRGKDPQFAPWSHIFKGDRINDYHLTLEEKHKSRGRS